MGFASDDAAEDRTIGLPRRVAKAPEPARRPEPHQGASPARPTPVEKYAPPPPPPAPRGELGPAPAGFGDLDDVPGTLMPLRPRTPASAPPPRPEADVERGRIPAMPPRPQAPASHWPDDDSSVFSGPIDPGWGASSESSFGTAPPPARGPSSPPPASGFVDSPWTVPGPEPKAPAPGPNPAPPAADPKTPQGFSRPQPQSPPRPAPPAPAPPSRPARPAPPPRDEMRTMGIGQGFAYGQEAPGRLLMLQYYDGAGHWLDLAPVQPEGHVVGRSSFRRNASTQEFLAAEHFRILTEGDRLFIEECETVNGVYRKVPPGQPVELADGARFQVGQSVIEFRLPELDGSGEPLRSPCGEVFRWRQVAPLAFLDFVGPDGGPGLRFPLTKLDGTVIGREGDIALTGDTWASRTHARVVRQGPRFVLEDLGSTNGTFVRVAGRAEIRPCMPDRNASGDVLLVGAVLVRVVEA